MQIVTTDDKTIQNITPIDHNAPQSKAALEAEQCLFAHYGLDYQVHFVACLPPRSLK